MLEKIRAKPHYIKQSISVIVTIVIFSAILFVWFSSRDARSLEIEVREKTVSPVDGVRAMFDGFLSGLKDRTSKTAPTNIETDIATTTDDFDFSGVVIIDDSMATTTINQR